MANCIICSIVEGLLPGHVVYEDKHTVAFLDNNPSAEGHTLLVPRTHAARVEDLTPEQAQALFSALYWLLPQIREAVGADGTTIGVNNGSGSGQEIRHVHIHVIPRRRSDGGGIVQSITQTHPSTAGLRETAEKIRLQTGYMPRATT